MTQTNRVGAWSDQEVAILEFYANETPFHIAKRLHASGFQRSRHQIKDKRAAMGISKPACRAPIRDGWPQVPHDLEVSNRVFVRALLEGQLALVRAGAA